MRAKQNGLIKVQCNWKVFVDNYLDGGYHVPILHKDLTTNLDISSYTTQVKVSSKIIESMAYLLSLSRFYFMRVLCRFGCFI